MHAHNEPAIVIRFALLMTCAWLSLGTTAIVNAGDETATPAADRPTTKVGPKLVVQSGHTGSVSSVAFSPRGRQVVTGSDDHRAVLWDATTGSQLRTLLGLAASIESVAFSADGRLVLAAGGSFDDEGYFGEAIVWNAATGVAVQTIRIPEQVHCAALSPDGRWVLTGGQGRREGDDQDVGVARLWEVATGNEREAFNVSPHPIHSLAFSPDGRRAAAGDDDGDVVLWDVVQGKWLSTLQAHTSQVTSVTFSSEGKQLLTGSWDRQAVLWDAITGQPVRSFRGHTNAISSVALSPDGKCVLTGGGDQGDAELFLWDAATGRQLQAFRDLKAEANSVAFSPDGRHALAGLNDGTARMWDASSGRPVRTFGGEAFLPGILFDPDGRQIHLAFGETLTSWGLAGMPTTRRFPGELTGAFSADGRRSVVINATDDALICDLSSGEIVGTVASPHALYDEKYAFDYMALNSDGTRLFTTWRGPFTLDGGSYLWDAATGKKLHTLVEPFKGSWVASAAFSADGRRLITGSIGQTATVWDVATGKRLRELQGHRYWVTAVAFSPNGSQAATGAGDHLVILWDVSTGKQLATFQGHTDWVTALAFSPDGRTLASGSADRTVILWDVATSKPLRTFLGHDGKLSALVFSPDGRRMLSSAEDGTVRLWDVQNGQELCSLFPTAEGTLIATPDNYYMAPKRALGSVAFRVGDRMVPYDQFDLKFNRADVVLSRLDRAPQDLIQAYQRAYQVRMQRMNFREEILSDDFHLPEVVVISNIPLSTSETSLAFQVKANDAKHLLDRLHVYVNGAPVERAAGMDLRDKETRSWEGEVHVELSPGVNTIDVSVFNQKGAESLRESFDVVCNRPAIKPSLYVVVVGVSKYQDTQYELNYAAKDADDLADFWEGKKERFSDVNILRLLDQDATREKILQAQDLLRQSGVNDQVVVFFAGHGLLDDQFNYYFATADVDFHNPADRGLSYESIDGLLDGVRARRKLLLIDTCHSGELNEIEKNGRELAPPLNTPEGVVKSRTFRGLELVHHLGLNNSYQLLQELFADLRRGTGAVVIAAAGGAEFALESPQWRNGVFTYAVLDGLKREKADHNQDDRIDASELRAYVTEQVIRLTGGQQSPTARAENLRYDFPLY